MLSCEAALSILISLLQGKKIIAKLNLHKWFDEADKKSCRFTMIFFLKTKLQRDL